MRMVNLCNKTIVDFNNFCKRNKWKFGTEIKNCNVDTNKNKINREELKKMNSKLVKRIAVVSLAALMSIPNMVTPNKALAGGITSSGTIMAGGKQQNTSNSDLNSINNNTNNSEVRKVIFKEPTAEDWQMYEYFSKNVFQPGMQLKIRQYIDEHLVVQTPKYPIIVNNRESGYLPYNNDLKGTEAYGYGLASVCVGATELSGMDLYMEDVRFIGINEYGVERYEVDVVSPYNKAPHVVGVMKGLNPSCTYVCDFYPEDRIETKMTRYGSDYSFEGVNKLCDERGYFGLCDWIPSYFGKKEASLNRKPTAVGKIYYFRKDGADRKLYKSYTGQFTKDY